MESHATCHKSNIKYAKITLKKRQQLVSQVLEKGQLVSKTAKKLSLRLSTAKLIVKRYKDEGTFFESKVDKAKRLKSGEKMIGNQNEERIPLNEEINENRIQSNLSATGMVAVDAPQSFYFENSWNPTFPFTYFNIEGMMFYHF